MKKFLINCFYFLLALTVTAAGFLMPSAMSSYQDKQIAAKIEHPAIEPMEFTYSSSLLDTLNLLSLDHYFVEYPASGSSRTDEELYEIMESTAKQIESFGIQLPTGARADYSAKLQLAIASANHYTDIESTTTSGTGTSTIKENEKSTAKEHSGESDSNIMTAVVWLCSMQYDSGYWIKMLIDDKSGKAIAFALFTEQTLLICHGKIDLSKFVDSLAAFIKDYYGLAAETVLQSIDNNSYVYGILFEISQAAYFIHLKEESGNTIQLPLLIRPEGVALNTPL